MKRLAVLGSTGSIGKSTLAVVDLHPEIFQVVSLAAGSRTNEIIQQVEKYRPALVGVHDHEAATETARRVGARTQVASGPQGIVEAAVHPDVDIVVAGIMGSAGLMPVFHALRAGKTVALANKETLVMAGDIIMAEVAAGRGQILPVDSEHSALHQCLRGSLPQDIQRLILTASGGPFLNTPREQMKDITVEAALNHPTWQMGRKITVDSASLMNKGLEVIEAYHLFGVRKDQVSVAIHPQSVVHSLVEFVDGNLLAQLSITDMRSAILYALSYPERWITPLPTLDLFKLNPLQFLPPDTGRFPCLKLAYEALEAGGTAPAVLNAANEVAVQAFLDQQILFVEIPMVIGEVLARCSAGTVTGLDAVLEADRAARREAQHEVRKLN